MFCSLEVAHFPLCLFTWVMRFIFNNFTHLNKWIFVFIMYMYSVTKMAEIWKSAHKEMLHPKYTHNQNKKIKSKFSGLTYLIIFSHRSHKYYSLYFFEELKPLFSFRTLSTHVYKGNGEILTRKLDLFLGSIYSHSYSCY